LKPKIPRVKINKIICCSFYAPPKSTVRNKLAEFLVATIGRLRVEHPGCRVILAGDRNDLRIELIPSLDPSLKQVVRGFTNKKKTKVLDVIYTDCADLMQEPVLLPPMQVDKDKVGKDSDHSGVQLLPRTNLAPESRTHREKVQVRPFPESRIVDFGFRLMAEDWTILEDSSSPSEMVDVFVSTNNAMVDAGFPFKEIQVGQKDLPYFTEELRQLKRQRLRAYTAHGAKSVQYERLRQAFDTKLENEAIKYRTKTESEVSAGIRGSGYQAIRKLGLRPGDSWKRPELTLPAYIEANLTPQQSANKLADYFSTISQTVEPLDESQFPPALREALAEGRASNNKPILTQHEVYCKFLRVTKPKSSVEGDIPKVLLGRYAYQYAQPATKIFNNIIKTSSWPRQWVKEEMIVLSKLKPQELPKNEDDLRTISKTPWLSKCFENILGDFILPIIDQYLDPGQCGGLKKSSIKHYLIKLLDFAHRTLDKSTPHCAILCTEDLSKAYNRGSHNLVVEDLHSMHVPKWTLGVICSYLKERSCILNYQNSKSVRKRLPGGFSAGTWLGGLLFIVKFNGACMRPPIPRPITKNHGMQVKYIDDASQMASVNLKKSLVPDVSQRARPLNYHERTEMVLNPDENVILSELQKFLDFTQTNKLVINKKKGFVMKFSRAKKLDFPAEITIGDSDILEVKKSHRILGIMVQDDLKWQSQCEEMVKRATSTTWALRRMRALGVPEATLVEYWKTEGRVMLEYGCPVWHSGLTSAQSHSLDRAQRAAMAAMAAITGKWEPSHSRQLAELGLERLSARRTRLCKTFAQRTATNSRHMDMFTPVTSARRLGTYREIFARTGTYYKSALPYLTRLLNQ
jgi:hypothetical protein